MISSYTYKFCSEDVSSIENYDKALLDTNLIYDCHHRLETHTSDGKRRLIDLTVEELKALGVYYKRPANELILLNKSEHMILHSENRSLDIFTSDYQKRFKWFNNGKVEVRVLNCPDGFVPGRLSFTEEHNRLHSESVKGYRHFTNGIKEVYCKECPEGFWQGRKKESVEAVMKKSKRVKGSKWWTNGEIDRFCKECPEGYIQGRSKNRKSYM